MSGVRADKCRRSKWENENPDKNIITSTIYNNKKIGRWISKQKGRYDKIKDDQKEILQQLENILNCALEDENCNTKVIDSIGFLQSYFENRRSVQKKITDYFKPVNK